MIFIWRGWGLLAIVAVFPLLASCAGLTDVEPKWVFGVGIVLSLLVAGVFCVHFGTRWNRPVVQHSLYFIPLQAWGWIYLALVTAVALFWVGAGLAVLTGLYQPPNQADPGRITAATVAGLVILSVVGVYGYTATRSGAAADESTTDDRESEPGW